MNIQVQICGIVVISLIMFFFYGNRKIGLFTEKVFSRVMIGAFICLVLDITSIVCIVNESSLPEWLIAAVCKAYLATLILMGYSGLDYTMTDIMSERKYHRLNRIFIGLAILEGVVVCCSPIGWIREDRVVYSFGLSTTLTYVFTFAFIISTIVILFVKRKMLNPKRRISMCIWMAMWVIAAGVQFVKNEYLLVGFAIALGMLTLFFMLENPESQQDRRLGCFNSNALLMFLRQVYERGERYAVMSVYLGDSTRDSEVSYSFDELMKSIISKLEEGNNYKVFKNVENELIVFSLDVEALHCTRDVIGGYLKKLAKNREAGSMNVPAITITTINDCTRVRSTEDLFKLNSRVRISNTAFSGVRMVDVSEKDINNYYRYNEVIKEIGKALEEDRIEVFYQPIYSYERDKYVSCEALARIRREDGSLVSPGEFIPVAEETGLIIEIGERVFTKVCELLSEDNGVSEKLDYIEVNLSVAQFEQVDLAHRFISIMEGYGVAPSKINLEITETASIRAKQSMLENMKTFLDFGVTFSLDDFGKGHSNLMYVVEMPVSIVKLDMDMIRAYFTEPKARLVVEATVKMAHKLGLHIVAEGVEDKASLDAMQEESIDFIQGYYFSKPVSKNSFIDMINNG
ncbi:MAG: EAL domain-containing protein [Lachnospiraceae bacterium]|nr:EAL domain-containing protein [Lachnospiraceae bacterium]